MTLSPWAEFDMQELSAVLGFVQVANMAVCNVSTGANGIVVDISPFSVEQLSTRLPYRNGKLIWWAWIARGFTTKEQVAKWRFEGQAF